MIFVNLIATKGDIFHCAAFGHVRRIRWQKDTPRDVAALRKGEPINWGGAMVAADQVGVIFDGDGNGPDPVTIARAVAGMKHQKQ